MNCHRLEEEKRREEEWMQGALPIIAVTANAFVSDEESCLSAGMNAHLAKPIDMGKLFALLARFVPSRP